MSEPSTKPSSHFWFRLLVVVLLALSLLAGLRQVVGQQPDVSWWTLVFGFLTAGVIPNGVWALLVIAMLVSRMLQLLDTNAVRRVRRHCEQLYPGQTIRWVREWGPTADGTIVAVLFGIGVPEYQYFHVGNDTGTITDRGRTRWLPRARGRSSKG